MNANIKSPTPSSIQDISRYMSNVGHAARDASREVGRASTGQKNSATAISPVTKDAISEITSTFFQESEPIMN